MRQAVGDKRGSLRNEVWGVVERYLSEDYMEALNI